MASQEMAWRDAIRAVLQDAGTPLHYQEIIKAIHDQGLRTLTGATPERTVNSQLSQMTRSGQTLYDSQIRKTARGYFEFFDPSVPNDSAEPVDDPIDDEPSEDETKIRVAAYGLYWKREDVDWGASQILGGLYPGAQSIEFSEQKGIYLLHSGPCHRIRWTNYGHPL